MRRQYFTKEVLAEAQAIALEPSLWNRPQMPGVTIDGVDSKDLDDAIWLQEHQDGVILLIHVADVSEYVAQDSALERVAFERTQTRYLKSGNEPMLPHILSENRLSLREQQARPTLTVRITLDHTATLQTVEIIETWISSLKQLSYPEVDQILKNEQSEFYPFLNTCLFWADRLYRQRTDPEQLASQPEDSWMDENGTWITNEGTRYHAYLIIQEFMIIANTAIAQWLAERNLNALYRNHIPNVDTDPQLIFQQLSQANWEGALHRQLQCGLNRAEYDLQPIGHFALKRLTYCHFTSPIRRLPDLINHRIIKAYLHGQGAPYPKNTLNKLRSHIESVQQTQAAETKEFFKSRHQEQYEALLQSPQQIQVLEPSEFSLLLRYAALSDQIDSLATAVGDRLATHQLTIEDWFVILFLSQHQPLQRQVLVQLRDAVHHAPSIIAIAQNQMEDWGDIDYRVQGQESPFEAGLVVEIAGAHWSSETRATYPRKQGAKHRACVEWIQAYCEHQLISVTPSILTSEMKEEAINPVASVVMPLSLEGNPISQLNELCQKYQWDTPDYLFYEEEIEGFMCECELCTEAMRVLGFGSGSKKAIAKQYAAQHVLEQICEGSSRDHYATVQSAPDS